VTLLPVLVAAWLAAAPAKIDRGETLFRSDCAGCHGPRGEGAVGPPLAVPRLSRARDDAALAKLIAGGVEGTEMPAARLPAPEIAQLVAWLHELGRRPAEVPVGDARRGEALYRGKGACQTCHALRGRGGAFGPDLTDVGLRRGSSYLRAALMTPEASVPRAFSPYRADISLSQNFLQLRVVTRAGAAITGVRLNEDTFSIQLRDATGRVHSFWKSELRELHKDWGRSPMPSYDTVFTPAELDDLVTFLAAQRGAE
jgi:putative heme-binding domain-containing protein